MKAALSICVSAAFLAAAASAASAAGVVAKVTYACADDKTIEATYYPDKVDLVLSDGRNMSLPQTMSGSGIRYANTDTVFRLLEQGQYRFRHRG